MSALATAIAMFGLFVLLPLALGWTSIYLIVLFFTRPRRRAP